MTGVFATFRSPRSRLTRVVGLLLFVAQVVAVGIAPSAEAVASHSAPAHVEDAGIHLHHSHNPNDCPACLALQIGANGLPSRVERPAPVAPRHPTLRVSHPAVFSGARRIEPHAPRPPPAILAASR